MDEESFGVFGLLLLVTVLVMTQPLVKSHAMPSLPEVRWEDVVNVFNCGQNSAGSCLMASNQ